MGCIMSSGGGTRRIRSAAEVPAFMDTEWDGRGGWVALALFAQHWNRYPEHRDWMRAAPLPKTTDLPRGALVAALVHSLCIRDGLPIPEWVLDWRHPTPITLSSDPMDNSPYSRSVRSQCPAVCDYHQAYFEISFRDKR